MNRLVLVLSTVVLLSPTSNATAQGFLNPFVGTTLTSPTDRGSSSKPGFGVALGSVGSIVGGETEIAYREIVQDAAGEWIERTSALQLQERGR